MPGRGGRQSTDGRRRPGRHGLGQQVEADAPTTLTTHLPTSAMARRVAAGVGQMDLGAGRDEGVDLAVAALRVVGRADHGHHDRWPQPGEGRGQGGRRVGLGAVAEHDVEQDHAGGRVGRRPRRAARGAASGRSSGGRVPGVVVVAEVDQRGVGARLGDQHAPPRLERATDEQARAGGCRSRARRGRAPATPARRDRAGAAPPRWPRSGPAAPAPATPSGPGCASPAAYAARSAATSSAGGLETSTATSTRGSASSRARAVRVDSPPTSAERSRPPTPYAAATPTPAWSSSASTCWQPVPDAATMPTGPGATTLAKPSPMPSTTAVPQSGPITSRPRSVAP